MHIRLWFVPWLLAALASCALVPPQARTAQSLIERGRFAEAEAAADDGLRRHPGHPALMSAKLQAILGNHEAERAVAVYQTWYETRGAHDRPALARMALTTLWQGLRVPSAAVRARAVQAVEQARAESLARDVTARLNDDDDVVAATAAVALLRSQPGAPQLATQLLDSEDELARAVAVEGIGRKIGKPARADLVAMLDDRAAAVRRATVDALAAMDTDRQRMAELATGDPDGDVRARALEALVRMPVPDAEALAIRALADGHGPARLAAVLVLAAHGTKQQELAGLVHHNDPWLALGAARALGTNHPDTAAALERLFGHEDPDIRARALDAAPDLFAPETAAAAALARLADPESKVRAASVRVLVKLTHERGTAALDALTRDADPGAREAAVGICENAGLITPGLVAALADPSPLIRVAAAQALLVIQ